MAHVNSLSACLVAAHVDSGWITLTGFVQWQYQRQDAAHAIRFLQGMVGLSNEIAIRASAHSAVSPTDIESALKRSSSRLAREADVSVVDGAVTLRSTIYSWAERDQAHGQAKTIPLGPCLIERLDDRSVDIIWGAQGQSAAVLPVRDVVDAREHGHLVLLD